MANTPESQFSRRTLAKGAAWAVPAVAVAVGAPAYAFSKLPAPTGPFSANLTACNQATVSWGGPSGVQYQVEYSVNGTDLKEATTVNGTPTDVTAGGTENIRAVRLRRYESPEAYSDWVTIPTQITGPTGFTYNHSAGRFEWAVTQQLINLGATYYVVAESPAGRYPPGTGTTTENYVGGNSNHNNATLYPSVCGMTLASLTWAKNTTVSNPNLDEARAEYQRTAQVESAPAQDPTSTPGTRKVEKPAKVNRTTESTPQPTPTVTPEVTPSAPVSPPEPAPVRLEPVAPEALPTEAPDPSA